jgi:glycerol uptake facilitator-like aquaporin
MFAAAAREFDPAEVRHGKHAILVVIITILGSVSGAHFNPAVSLVMAALAALERSCAASDSPSCRT